MFWIKCSSYSVCVFQVWGRVCSFRACRLMGGQTRTDRHWKAAGPVRKTGQLQVFSVCLWPRWIHRASSAVSVSYDTHTVNKPETASVHIIFIAWIFFFSIFFIDMFDSWTSVKRRFMFFRAERDTSRL